MKIDAKLRDTVPDPEPSQVAACSRLSTASGAELLALLKRLVRIPWERDRIEPRLWVPVLDHFDVLLRVHVHERRYSPNSSAPDEAVDSVDDELVVEILRVSELLLQQTEKLRRAYGSLESVSALLEADNLKVLQAALQLLRLLLKRGRSVDPDLHRRLAPLATAWSPIDPQLTLLRACQPVEEGPFQAPMEVSFEYRAGTTPRGSLRVESLQVPRAQLANTVLADLVARTIEERQIPEGPCRSELRSRLLVARALLTKEGRCLLVAVRILALGVMLQTSGSFQKYLSAYPGLLAELVELLRHLPELDTSVAEATMLLLGSLVRERTPHQRQLGQLLQLNAPHGLVLSLVRTTLAPPRPNVPVIPPATVEAVLHFFLSCVGVSNTGAPGHTGIIACLLEFTSREGLEWHPAIGLAYRAIEAIIDIVSGAATSLFRDLNGQGALAQRLAIALEGVKKHPEVPEQSCAESPEALVHCWECRLSLTLQRGRVGSILRCVLAGLRAEATRGPGVLRGPLTPLVHGLLSEPNSVGASAFTSAASIVAHLIGDDPSCVGALIENGVIPAFLDAIKAAPAFLRAPEAFQIVATVLGAVHLHDAGEREVRDRCTPHPFKDMVRLLVDPAAFRTLGGAAELHSALGGSLDEVAQNRVSMRSTLVGFAISGLDELISCAKTYPAWSPQPVGAAADAVADPTEQYADRLAAFGRFLESFLAQSEVASSFAQQGGVAKLVEALTMGCLPPLFVQLAPGHPLVLIFRALTPGGYLAEAVPATSPAAKATSRLVGLEGPLSDLRSMVLPEQPLSQLPSADASFLARRLAAVGTVLSVHATGHRDIISLSAVQSKSLAAAANAIQEMTPMLLWLHRQCSMLGAAPSDPYADGGAGRDTSTDYTVLVRDAYKIASPESSSGSSAAASGAQEAASGGQSEFSASVVALMLWRTLFSARHFLVSVVAKQLSLPARRPNRLFVPPPALAPAARSAANGLAELSQQLLAAIPEDPENFVMSQSEEEVLHRLRYLSETLELLYRAHVDDKHHHVRMLCVDRLHKMGVYAKPLEAAGRFVLSAARRSSASKADGLQEAMQRCLQGLSQYFEKLTSFKLIQSAPAPPTSLQPAERESFGPESPPAPPAAMFARFPVTAAAGAPADAGANAPAATGDAGGDGSSAEPMTGVEAAGDPTPTTGGDAATETAVATTPATATAEVPGSDEIDPWALWAALTTCACHALLPFWQETQSAVVRLYTAKAAKSILQAFLNSLDDTDGRVLPDAGSRQAAPGAAGPTSLSERMVQALIDMGFPRRRVEVALWNTGSASIEFAMEWLINHPEPEPEASPPEGQAGDASGAPGAGADGDTATGNDGMSTSDSVAASLSEALTALRRCLLSRLAFVGARIGKGTELVELTMQMAQLTAPLKDASAETPAAVTNDQATTSADAGTSDSRSSGASGARTANARTLYDEMVTELQRISAVFPMGHPAWVSSEEPSEEQDAANGGAAFALGVVAQLLHHRPLVMALVEGGPPGRVNDFVVTTLGLVRSVLTQREASMPTTCTDLFAQGYTSLYGNLALPSANSDDLPAKSKPPAWLDAAFVALHEATQSMFLMPLPGALAETLHPAPPQLPSEVQSSLVTAALDTITLFPKAGGNTVHAVLLLLQELCAVPANAACLAAYPRAGLLLEASGNVVSADGGGLLALLRLPRHARCPGLLRLVSDISGKLLEDDSFHAQQIEEQVLKLFATNDVVELRTLFDRMQPWLRTCPQIFEEVLKGLCQVRTVKNSSGEVARTELVLAPEADRKPFRPTKGDSGMQPQQVLQRLLDHLLWTMTLERGSEKLLPAEKEGASADATAQKEKPSSPSSPAGAAGGSSSSTGDGPATNKEAADAAGRHLLALPADSILFILQSIVVCYPQCAAVFAKSSHSAANLESASDTKDAPRRGQWAPLLDRPAGLPPAGIHIAGKAVPACSASKSPLTFLLRKILATSFFASDPSQATITTLQKVASVLSTIVTKHHDTRNKVLHESVSLLRQLANHVETSGGPLASPRRPPSFSGSSSMAIAPRSSGAASDMASDLGDDDGTQRLAPGALAAGVAVLCELLQSTHRSVHGVTPAERPETPGVPAPPRPGSRSSEAAAASTPAAAAPAANASAPAVPAGPATTASTSSGGILNVAESRTLRMVLCRLLAAVNLYHSEANTTATHLVRCLEILTRTEILDTPAGSTKPPGSSGGGPSGQGPGDRPEGAPPMGQLLDAISSALSPSGGVPGGSEDVEMSLGSEDGGFSASVHVTLASEPSGMGDMADASGPGSLDAIAPDFDEDDSVHSQSFGAGMDRHRGREYSGGDGDGDGDPNSDGGGAAAMLADENEDDGPEGDGGSEDDDEQFDEEAEEEEEGDGAEEDGQVDEDVGEWEETDGEESEDDVVAGHGHGIARHGEEQVSFIVDLGDGRSRIMGRAGPHGGPDLNVPPDAADRFFQTLSGLGIPGLTISGRPARHGEWVAVRQSWGWEGDLDLPSTHPMLTGSSPSQGANQPPSSSQPVFNPAMFMDGGPMPPPDQRGGGWGADGSNPGGANASGAGDTQGRPGRWDATLANHLSALLPAAPAPPIDTPPAAPAAATASSEPAATPAATPATGPTPGGSSEAAATPADQASAPKPPEAPEASGGASGDAQMAVDTPQEVPQELNQSAPREAAQMVVEESMEASPPEGSPAPAPTPSAPQGDGEAAGADSSSPMEVDSGMPPIPIEGTPLSAGAAEPAATTEASTAAPAATPSPAPTPEPAAPAQPQGLDYGVGPLRTLATSLNVTQETVLEVVGVDPQFLEGLPPDLRDEIVLQQLSTLDLDSIRRLVVHQPASAGNAPAEPGATAAPGAGTTATPTGDAAPNSGSGDGMEGVTTGDASADAAPAPGPSGPEAAAATAETAMSVEAPVTGEAGGAPAGTAETAPGAATTETAATAEAAGAGAGTALDDAAFAGEWDQDVLDALPPDIRAEVLNDQRMQREAAERAAAATAAPADPTNAQDMDNASFIATLTPELRQEVLLTVTEEVLHTLPPEIVAEAQLVRERTFQRTARARAAAEQEVVPRAAAQAGLVLGADGQWRPGRAAGGPAVVAPARAQHVAGGRGQASITPAWMTQGGAGRGGPPAGGAGRGAGRHGEQAMSQVDLIQLLRGQLSGLNRFMTTTMGQQSRHGGWSQPRRTSSMPPLRMDQARLARYDDATAEQPIEIQHTTTVCRLLFLRKAVPRATMERLFFNLGVHPVCREALLRRFLQVLVWQLPHDSRGSEFPPRHLYKPSLVTGTSSADSAELGALEACCAPHVAQQVSGGRVLHFLSFLLPRIPQTAEFFAKRICYREIANVITAPDGDEYRRKKKKADRSDSGMEICAEAPGTDEAAINLLIRHTAPDRWSGHVSAGHTPLLLVVLRMLLVPPPPAPAAGSTEAAASGSAAPAPAAGAAAGASASPAPASGGEAAAAPPVAAPASAATPAPASSGEATATAAAASDATVVGGASSSAAQAEGAALAEASQWALKLQALLTPESAAALCAHLCGGGSEPKAAQVVAAVLKGPADVQLKACIRDELLRHVRETVGKVEAALTSSLDAYGVHLQAAGDEAAFLQLLQTLQSLFTEVGNGETAASTGGEAAPPRSVPSVSAPAMTLSGILADAHAERVWMALDATLVRVVEQWAPGDRSAKPTSPFSTEKGTASATGGTSSSSSAEGEREKAPPPPLLHGLLPLIEAFFLANKPEKKAGTTDAPERPSTPGGAQGSATTSGQIERTQTPMAELSREEKAALEPKTAICAFGEKHKKAINALVRQAPVLLSSGFSPLMEAAPWALDFDNKRHYLRQRLRALRGDLRYDVVRLHVRRSMVFMDSYHQLHMRSGEEMRGKLSVTFVGEEAMDAGGVAREWFKILAREIFNPNYALFTQAGGKACTFHPNKTSYVNPDHLRFFSFIGRIIGKALFDGHHLEAYFTRSFYKHMLRRKVTAGDMEALDPDYYKNLRWMLDNSVEGVLGHLTFTAESDEFGRVKTVELKPGGAAMPVTDENKREYVQLMCEHKMTKSVQAQINAFLEGFHELVPPTLISLFDDKELELLISGLPEIDIDDLRKNTDYHNYAEATPQIQWFWKVLGEFNKEQKAWFLQFVTGTSQVPIDGFKGLIGMRGPQKFSIHRAEGGNRLPTAHTCFNQLDLPEYDTEDQMRKKLVQAVAEAHEGFGFV